MIKRIAIGAIVILMLVPAATLWSVLHSEAALRWVVARVEAHYPGRLSVGSVSGTLMGSARLTDVRINAPVFDAHIRTLSVTWQPLALLSRRLHINRLQATHVEVRLKARPPHAAFRFVRPRPPRLPLSLMVSHLEVSHLTLVIPQLSAPLVMDRVVLTANLNNRAWAVSSVSAEGARVHVQGHAAWDFQHGEQVQAGLQWQLRLARQPPFIGAAQIAGDELEMRLKASMSAPFHLQLTAGLHHMFTAPAWRGELTFNELDPQRLRAAWPQVLVRGSLNLRGDPHATRLYGDISAHQQKYGDWHSRVDMRWANNKLAIRTLDLERAQTATRFNLSGQIGYADAELAPELHGEWRSLAIPLSGRPWLSSPHGKLVIGSKGEQVHVAMDGTLANGGSFSGRGDISLRARHSWTFQARAHNFQVALQSLNKGRPLPPMNWQLQMQGDETQTRIQRFTGTWLSGRVQASGQINHAGSQPWQFGIRAQGINPAALYPLFPGTLGLAARISGRLREHSTWKLQVMKLQGELRNTRVQASGILSHAGGNWQFQNADARMGSNNLRLNGRYGKQSNFTWSLDAPDLAAVWPDIAGKLVSDGQANLSGPAPVLNLTVNGESLRYRDYALGKITARIDMQGTAQTGHASLSADNLQLKDFVLDTLTAQAQGSLRTHSLTAKFTSPYGNGVLGGHGAFNNGIWRGNLSEVALSPRGAGQWRNVASWQPSIDGIHFSLPEACVGQGASRACIQVNWQPAHWQTDGMLSGVPMRALQALLPQGLGYEGSFGGTLHMQGAAGSRSLDLSASLSPGAIRNVINRRNVTLLAYSSGYFKLHSDTHLTAAQLIWSLKDGGYVDIHSQISHGQHPAVSGSIHAEMHHFDLIPALIPAVGNLAGKLKINLTLSGTPSDPQFNGSASLVDGAIVIPRFGLHVTDVLLNLDGNGEHLSLNGKARSGTGSLDWQSSAVRKNGIWHAEGKLGGKNFRTADIPEAHIDVSPDIDFKLDNRDIYLDGTLNVPYAKLRPRDLSHTAQVSPDQVIVGGNGEPPAEKWRVHAQVSINMGQDVDLAGFGLTGRIIGGVLAVDEPGHYTTGNGELQIVNGKYTAYGQKLKIDRGRLMFNGGPISNPALDIRAIRPPAHPETVLPGSNAQTVGVLVRGTLRNPQVSLFSNPPLPQAQLLTYLLTGQAPVSQNQSPLVGAPPTTAGTSLALTGGQLLVQEVGQEVGQHVGIQDVGVQNVSTGPGTSTAALFFGKYLSPRLYVSYGVGLLQPLNTVRIRYTLSTRWMLEAESGSFANSADLIYTIER